MGRLFASMVAMFSIIYLSLHQICSFLPCCVMVIKVAQGSVPWFVSLIISIKALLSNFLFESHVSNCLIQSLKKKKKKSGFNEIFLRPPY
jgi:hypothetical protein